MAKARTKHCPYVTLQEHVPPELAAEVEAALGWRYARIWFSRRPGHTTASERVLPDDLRQRVIAALADAPPHRWVYIAGSSHREVVAARKAAVARWLVARGYTASTAMRVACWNWQGIASAGIHTRPGFKRRRLPSETPERERREILIQLTRKAIGCLVRPDYTTDYLERLVLSHCTTPPRTLRRRVHQDACALRAARDGGCPYIEEVRRGEI